MAMSTNHPPREHPGTVGSGSGHARENAQEMTGSAQEKAQEMAGQAQEKAQAAAGQVQSRLREQVDQRSAQAAEHINSQASDLRAVGDSLREQGKDGPAQAADRLAQYAERAGGYLQDKDSDALLADVEDFARRQPWAVAAGGLIVGFAASRFLKASSRKRYTARSDRRLSPTPSRAREVPAHLTTSGAVTGPPVPPAPAAESAVGSAANVPPGPPVGPPQDVAPSSPASPIPGAE
jgi:gas vesicle protein